MYGRCEISVIYPANLCFFRLKGLARVYAVDCEAEKKICADYDVKVWILMRVGFTVSDVATFVVFENRRIACPNALTGVPHH